jgi:hypothetical protein
LVKIKLSPSKKRYLRGKHVYDYVRAHLPVPHKFLIKLEQYFKEDFEVEINEDNKKVVLTYTYFKKSKN